MIESQKTLTVRFAVKEETGEPVRLTLDSGGTEELSGDLSMTLDQLHIQADFSQIDQTTWVQPEICSIVLNFWKKFISIDKAGKPVYKRGTYKDQDMTFQNLDQRGFRKVRGS